MTNSTGTFQPQGRAVKELLPALLLRIQQPRSALLAPASQCCSSKPGLTAATTVKVVTGIWGFWLKCLHAFHAGAQQFKQLEGEERAAAENKQCLARVSTAQYNQVM